MTDKEKQDVEKPNNLTAGAKEETEFCFCAEFLLFMVFRFMGHCPVTQGGLLSKTLKSTTHNVWVVGK